MRGEMNPEERDHTGNKEQIKELYFYYPSRHAWFHKTIMQCYFTEERSQKFKNLIAKIKEKICNSLQIILRKCPKKQIGLNGIKFKRETKRIKNNKGHSRESKI